MKHLLNPLSMRTRRQSVSGQTLIIALIIMGVLLIVGFVFLGIVNRSIVQGTTNRQRSAGYDLAEAGVRYAHQQLLTSEPGADWRGLPTKSNSDKDPDADLLGKPAQYPYAGPDGFGPWTRVTFASGRALVRVRYAPSDLSDFQDNPSGVLRKPGKSRSYLMIESVGRPGLVSAGDPTLSGGSSLTNQKKLVAFCSIGLMESARFITNKYNVTRAVELGVPTNLGLTYSETYESTDPSTPKDATQVRFPLQVGTQTYLYNFYNKSSGTPVLNGSLLPFGGSLQVNGNVVFHGTTNFNLCKDLGDYIRVSGVMDGADPTSQFVVNTSGWNGTNWVTSSATYQQGSATTPISSRDQKFNTSGGVVRDGLAGLDGNGYPRAVGRKEPPSLGIIDPATGQNRYVRMTRESGILGANGNTGRFGHGRNVYVNNADDVQVHGDEQGRINAGSSESLVYDWLNPNNGQANSGWRGPFYVPRGAYLKLLTDGFIIARDAKGPEDQRTWRRPDGSDTTETFLRFRLGQGTDGKLHLLNKYTTGFTNDIEGTLLASDFNLGPQFDGVLYFEGNVRVRGIIPTDVQLSVVSNASIYIEGSIAKGLRDSTGALLVRPSKSSIGLFARQYVALNTSQFFGPGLAGTAEAVKDVPSAISLNPLRVRQPDGAMLLHSEHLLDPTTGTASNPSTWQTYAVRYVPAGTNPLHNGGNSNVHRLGYLGSQSILLTHTMDDGPGAATYFGIDVNPGLPIYTSLPTDKPWPTYLFDQVSDNTASSQYASNYQTPGYSATGYIPLYGLGGQVFQRYAKFETTSFPLLLGDVTGSHKSDKDLSGLSTNGTYQVLTHDGNDFVFTINNISSNGQAQGANDYLIAKAGLVPHDIRIEAAIFAEEGSFFVIPGQWFNPNPNDRRELYPSYGATDAARRDVRKENFGSNPEAPFYGEPIDVRVQIVGSVSENMPPDISQQGEWLKKWGWIPREIGSSGQLIPGIHVPSGYDATSPNTYIPNLTLTYDPMLGTGRAQGFLQNPSVDPGIDPLQEDPNNPVLRRDDFNRALPPIPRLPVSPALSYFGEANP